MSCIYVLSITFQVVFPLPERKVYEWSEDWNTDKDYVCHQVFLFLFCFFVTCPFFRYGEWIRQILLLHICSAIVEHCFASWLYLVTLLFGENYSNLKEMSSVYSVTHLPCQQHPSHTKLLYLSHVLAYVKTIICSTLWFIRFAEFSLYRSIIYIKGKNSFDMDIYLWIFMWIFIRYEI